MSVEFTNIIKRVIGVIVITIILGAVIYGLLSDNCTLAIMIILFIRLFAPLLRVSEED